MWRKITPLQLLFSFISPLHWATQSSLTEVNHRETCSFSISYDFLTRKNSCFSKQNKDSIVTSYDLGYIKVWTIISNDIMKLSPKTDWFQSTLILELVIPYVVYTRRRSRRKRSKRRKRDATTFPKLKIVTLGSMGKEDLNFILKLSPPNYKQNYFSLYLYQKKVPIRQYLCI